MENWLQNYDPLGNAFLSTTMAAVPVVVLLTAAGSAVGRLLGKLLTDRGVKVIRLVRSEAGGEKLAGLLPGSPIFATDAAGWKERARAAASGALRILPTRHGRRAPSPLWAHS